MLFYWMIDRIRLGQFGVWWRPGFTNMGDYHSKYQPSTHHIKMRHVYLYEQAM